MTNLRVAVERRAGRTSAAAAVTKLARSTLARRLEDAAMRLHGPHATAWHDPDGPGAQTVARFLHAPCETIVGGTSDIQRNIIGERILGLPRERAQRRS
jgi:alkylation response protein AidB-like acyl-CoA dehydrogenase